ncbi:unnamed protein product, partial [Brenthis ino]
MTTLAALLETIECRRQRFLNFLLFSDLNALEYPLPALPSEELLSRRSLGAGGDHVVPSDGMLTSLYLHYTVTTLHFTEY